MPLNTSTPVVDFLKSRGLQAQSGEKFPLFDTRKKLFEQAGLNSNLGDFIGSGEQNTSLLNMLQKGESNAGVSINPDNLFKVMGLNATSAQSPVNTSVGSSYGSGGTTPPPSQINDSLASLARQAANPTIPTDLQERALVDVTSTAAFPLQQETVQAQKEALQIQSQARKERLLADLASRGLAFSGQAQKGLNTLDADVLSKELGIDRKFALLIANGLDTSAQKMVKEAQKGSQDAASALGALGYVLTPDGQLIQKPSDLRAEQSAQRADQNLALSEQRFAQQQDRNAVADERALRAEQRSIEAANRAAAAFNERNDNTPINQKTSQFIQYLGTSDGTKTKADFEREAIDAGLNPQDKDIRAVIDSGKIKFKPTPGFFSSVRSALGF